MASFGGQSQQRWGDNTVNANEYMRDLMLTDLSGRPTATADARRKGMLVLVFFKASEPTSAETITQIQKLADAYKDTGKLSVYGISLDDEATTRAFADQAGLKFPLMLDYDNYHAMVYGIVSVPTVFLVDGSGMVLRKSVGSRPAILNEMSERIAQFAEVESVVIV